MSCIATFWFFWLLVRLPNLCPLCPWNHLLNYAAFGAAVRLARTTPGPEKQMAPRPLALLVVSCVALFTLIQLGWILARSQGYVR